jgi:large subunit ribosomal protein L1
MDSIMRAKPEAVKGPFLHSAYVTSTMGPGIPVDIGSLQALKPSE